MFTTYSASAGSGKTTNLVADYLSLCFRFDLRHPDRAGAEFQLDLYQRILAITFTNNASGEMKSRIVDTLRTFAFEDPGAFSPRAAAIYGMVVRKLFGERQRTDTDVIRRFIQVESRELLRRIIFDYARFTITTIDSFFQRVIRSSALSLNLNLNYTVQIDMDEFYLQAIDQLLNELSAETDLARRIIFMLDNTMEDTGRMDVDRTLKASLQILYENAEKNIDCLHILNASDHEEMREYIRSLRRDIKDIPGILKEKLRPITEEGGMWVRELDLKFKRPTFQNWFSRVQEDPIANFAKTIEDFYGSNGQLIGKSRLTPDEQARADRCLPHIEDCFRRVVEQQNVWRRRYMESVIRHKNADKLMMLSDLKAKMEEIKIQNNFFILSESNTLIYETIRRRGFETLFDRVKFDNFFIDEFQDTSKMQWEDLKPVIINNALSQSDRQVSLFGDVKQAIYRFRNGDADLFYKLMDYDRMREDPDLRMVDPAHHRLEPLDTNYRSLAAVVRFNNDFFDYYSRERQLDKYYAEGLRQKVHNRQPGMVQVCLYSDKGEKHHSRTRCPADADLVRGLVEDEAVGVQDMEVLLAVADARRRGYSDGDIAVLCRNHSKCGRLADIMLQLGWNVVTKKSLSIGASPEVNLVISTMQYLLHPEDILSQSAILHYLSKLRGRERTMENDMPTLRTEGAFEKLLKKEFKAPIPRRRWISEPLFLLVKDIMLYYGMQRQQNPFLVEFENLVLQYLRTRNGELSKFLMWWQQQRSLEKLPSLSLPDGQNAIRVSTIHASKGLEYPVVIFPYTPPKKTLPPVWDKVDDRTVALVELTDANSRGNAYEDRYAEESRNAAMDDLNVLYVTHTRARDVLYIIAKKTANAGKAYGDYLYKFITDEEVHKDMVFEQDPDDPRFFYAGDPDWSRPESPRPEEGRGMPEMVLSDFGFEQVPVACGPMLSEDGPRAEGTFVHDFLSGLAGFPQTEEEFDHCLVEVPEAKKPRLRAAYRHIMEDAALRPCFAPGVKVLNEVNILDDAHREHRPDRVVFLEDKVVVIDYKTGSPHPQYQKQIDEYCALLRNMGYENVEGRLLYV